jgi:predicted DNA-binding transcriptional regulator
MRNKGTLVFDIVSCNMKGLTVGLLLPRTLMEGGWCVVVGKPLKVVQLISQEIFKSIKKI